jgi:hypothetical protein
MADDPKGLFKGGGIALGLSGALFVVKLALDVTTGPPPSHGTEILAWMARERLPLAFVSEVLFIAGMLLIPGGVALYASLASREGPKASVGAGALAVTLPVLFVVAVVHGRLVYDVYGLRVRDPAVAELTVALYAGGMHAVFLMLAVATLVLSLAMRSTYGWAIAGLGIATAVLEVAAAYPWAIGTPLLALTQIAVAGWFIAVGAKLWLLGGAVAGAS